MSLLSRIRDQVNPFDHGKTFKNPNPRPPVNPYSRNQYAQPAHASIIHDITHNPLTNIVGSYLVKPVAQQAGQFEVNASNQLYNRAVAPLLNLPKQDLQRAALNQSVNRLKQGVGATGTTGQTLSSGAITALNLLAPGSSKALEGVIASKLPSFAPAIVPKVLSSAAVGSQIGGAANTASYLGNNQQANPLGAVKAYGQGAVAGAAGGALIPVAAPVVKGTAKLGVKIAKNPSLDSAEITALKAQKQTSIDKFHAATSPKVAKTHLDNVNNIDAQIKQLKQIGAVGKNVNKAPNVSKSEAEQYATVFNVPKSEAVKQLQQIKSQEIAVGNRQVKQPKAGLAPVSKGVKQQLNPKVPFKRAVAENTQLNPTKVNIPEVQPGDYARARLNPQQASNPIDIATQQAVNAAKKLSKKEQAMIPHLVENPSLAKSKAAREFVARHNDLTNLTHATSQSLGGNTNFVPNYFRHNVDLSNPKDAARWEKLVAKRGGQAADPYAFGGIDNMNRVFNSVKELEDAGFHLKNTNDPIQNIIDYGKSSANTLKRQALVKAITEADMAQPLKNRNFDLGNGQVVPVSEKGLKEIRAYALHDPSKNAAIKGVRTANTAIKTSILSGGQFHPINISVLRAGPSIAMPKIERLLQGDITMGSHPIRAAKGVGATFRPLLPGGKGAVDKMYAKAMKDTVVDPGTGAPINYVEAAAKIGAPFGARGYDVTGTALKSGVGHKLVFERQMPMMHNQVIRSIVHDLVKDGIPLDSPAAREAGIAANSTMGFINKEALNISPKVKQGMSDWMLASQFTPSKIVTLSKVGKGGVAGQYARADVASNVAAATAMIVGVGYLLHQKSDSLRDSLLRAIVNPAVPTPMKDKNGNNVELRIPLTYTGEISKLLGIKLKRQEDGHLGIDWKPGNAPDTVAEWMRSRLSPLPAVAVKLKTNTDFGTKPLYDPTAPAGTKAIQSATTIGQGFLPIGAQGLPYTEAVKKHLPGTARAILDQNTPGSNPLVKSGLSSVGFSPRVDQTTGKALGTSQYYETRDKFANSLKPDERALFDKIAAPKKDSFGNKAKPTNTLTKVADYGDLVANQDFANKYQKYQQSQKNHDPLWDLSPDQLRSYMQAQVISKNDPGGDSTTVRQLYARLPDGFFSARDAYFASLKKSGAKFDETKYNTKPGMPDNLVAFADAYHNLPYGTGARSKALRTPEGQAYIAWLDQNRIYNNQERADLGLPPLEDTSNSYASSGGKGNYSKSGYTSDSIANLTSLNKKVANSKVKAVSLKSFVKKPGATKIQKPRKI